jgi:F0F1-type ATP synthase membrane subunit c/vacuolar-type H+-ATPase subunit K
MNAPKRTAGAGLGDAATGEGLAAGVAALLAVAVGVVGVVRVVGVVEQPEAASAKTTISGTPRMP